MKQSKRLKLKWKTKNALSVRLIVEKMETSELSVKCVVIVQEFPSPVIYNFQYGEGTKQKDTLLEDFQLK